MKKKKKIEPKVVVKETVSSEGFKAKFIDFGVIKSFVKKLNKCLEKDDHFPYIPLFQSSGYGKSKIIFELAKKKFFTIYWCLRKNHHNGFPVQSVSIKKALEGMVMNIFFMIILIIFFLFLKKLILTFKITKYVLQIERRTISS